MKRKIFSKLLMVAMLIASVSAFVSCKDYDDDINKLTNDVTSLQTQLSTLNSALQTAQQNIQTAQATADAAKQAGNDAKAAAATAQAAAEQAKVDAINEAKTLVENLAAQIADGYVTEEDFNAAVAKLASKEEFEAAVAKLATKEELTAAKDDLNGQIAAIVLRLAAIDEKLVKLGEKDAELAGLIGKNTTAIADNAAAILQLKNQVKADSLALEAFKTLAGQTYATKTAVAEAVAAVLQKANTRIDSLKNAIASELTAYAKKTDLEGYAKKTDLDAYAKSLSVDTLKSRMQNAERAIQGLAGLDSTKVKQIVEGLGGKVDTLNFNAVKSQLSAVASNVDLLSLYITKQLTSLVFRPEYYFDGIEGGLFYAVVDAPTMKFNSGVKNNSMNLDTRPGYAKENYVVDEDTKISIYPDGKMAYHFNPTTADLTGWNIQFYNNTAKTRAAGTVNVPFAPKNAVLAENDFVDEEPGIVYVRVANSKDIFAKAKANYGANNSGTNDKITTIALQAIRSGENGDTVVTSDYALMKVEEYKNFVLADANYNLTALTTPKLENGTPVMGAHLYQTSTTALGLDDGGKVGITTNAGVAGNLYKDGNDLKRRHEVMYNATFNLNEFVETHFQTTKNLNLQQAQQNNQDGCVLDADVFKELGLSYKFTAIHYLVDPNDDKTDQYNHIHINADGTGYIVEVNSDGTQKLDADGNPVQASKKGVVGRKPLVRVELIGKEKTLAVGYIMLEVVEEVVPEGKEEAAIDLGGVFYANCGNLDMPITWSMIENQVLYELGESGMSANTFFNTYKPNNVNTGGTSTPVQYVKKADGTYVTVEAWNRQVFASLASAKKDAAVPSNNVADAKKAIIADFYANGGIGVLVANNITANVENKKLTADATLPNTNDFPVALKGWGTVTFTWYEPSAQTSIAKWTLDGNVQGVLRNYPDFVDPTTGLSANDLKTWVRLDNGNNPLYIELDVKTGKLAFAHASLDASKIPNRWFASASKTEGSQEIHANVYVPGSTQIDVAENAKTYSAKKEEVVPVDEFKFDILSTFANGKLNFDGLNANKFGNFAAINTGYIFEFNNSIYNTADDIDDDTNELSSPVEVKGASGATYGLYIKENGANGYNELYAIAKDRNPQSPTFGKYISSNKDELVISLGKDHATNAENNQIVTINLGDADAQPSTVGTTYACDILNYAGHADLANTFVTSMMVSFKNLNTCYQPFLDGANTFDIRYLRPVDIAHNGKAAAKDGVDNGSEIHVGKILSLNDWRDYSFMTKDQDPDYFVYYGVTKIEFNPSYTLSDEHRSSDAVRTIISGETEDEFIRKIEAAAALGEADNTNGLVYALEFNPQIGLYVQGAPSANTKAAKPSSDPDNDGWKEFVPKLKLKDDKTAEYIMGANAVDDQIIYINSQNVARLFHLYIPVRVTYFAGVSRTTYVVVEVNGTEANTGRRK